jgi:hypothetical protein
MSNVTVNSEIKARKVVKIETKDQDERPQVKHTPTLLEEDFSIAVKTQFGKGLMVSWHF